MPTTPHGFSKRLERLRADLAEQGHRVRALVEAAFDATYARDPVRANIVKGQDDVIDKVDVEVEKAAVALLTDATHENARLDASQLREVLTIVKINNELERVADAAVAVANRAEALKNIHGDIPPTFNVLTNSVQGILRDAIQAFNKSDARLAKVVLQSEDAVEAFMEAVLKDAERRIAAGTMSVDFAFTLHQIANEACRVADHSTNISEQVLYSITGAIVRHQQGGWVEVPRTA
jgi:phosphate transport system protein